MLCNYLPILWLSRVSNVSRWHFRGVTLAHHAEGFVFDSIVTSALKGPYASAPQGTYNIESSYCKNVKMKQKVLSHLSSVSTKKNAFNQRIKRQTGNNQGHSLSGMKWAFPSTIQYMSEIMFHWCLTLHTFLLTQCTFHCSVCPL